MERKIRVAQIGCGKMSEYTMRYVLEKGGEIVLAFDKSAAIIDEDIGSIMGINKRNVVVESIRDLEKRLMEEQPDIAIVTTMSLLNDLEDVLRACVKSGVNVVTTCEEILNCFMNLIVWLKRIMLRLPDVVIKIFFGEVLLAI